MRSKQTPLTLAAAIPYAWRCRILVRLFSATKDNSCRTISLRNVPIRSFPRRVSNRSISNTTISIHFSLASTCYRIRPRRLMLLILSLSSFFSFYTIFRYCGRSKSLPDCLSINNFFSGTFFAIVN